MDNSQLFKIDSIFFSVFSQLCSNFMTRHCAYCASKQFFEFCRTSTLAYFEFSYLLVIPESNDGVEFETWLYDTIHNISLIDCVDISIEPSDNFRYNLKLSINLFS